MNWQQGCSAFYVGKRHVVFGTVNGCKLVDAESIEFKETPVYSSFNWHKDPTPQDVITLAGELEFTTLGGETFTLHPGETLVAEDHTGSDHKWHLINDQLWKRAYVIRMAANSVSVSCSGAIAWVSIDSHAVGDANADVELGYSLQSYSNEPSFAFGFR